MLHHKQLREIAESCTVQRNPLSYTVKIALSYMKRTLSFTNFSISPERKGALENICRYQRRYSSDTFEPKFISAQVLKLYWATGPSTV
jgi:hypothetical protein